MNFRLQDSIARVAYAAQTSSLAHDRADLMPMVFMVLLCQNESTKEALHSAGLHGGILPSLLKNALLDLDDIREIVNEANTLTYDPQFEEEVFENPTILSWIANAAIHVMSVGRHSGVIDVYDLLVVLRTQMREGSSMARLWDAGGLTLLALRQHDAYLHGKGGVFTLAPPATTEWLADFLDETLCLDEEDDDAEASLEHDAEPEADLDVAETSEQSDDTIEQSDEKAKEEKPTDSVTPVSQKPTSHKPVVEEVSLEDLPPELQPRAENMRVMRINLDASQGDEAANAAMEAIRQLFVDQIRQVNDRLNGEEGGDGSDVMSDERTDDEATAKKQPLSREEKFLRSCTRNLSAEAEAGQIDPLIGRDDEVTRICEILCCRRKNKPLILGESGSGKTALVEGLALRIVRGEVPPALRDVRLYALNASSLVSRFKGAFAEKLSEIAAVLKKVPNAVLFIDNLHMLINGNDGNSQEEYNALGHLVSDDRLRLIATTTFRSWRQTFSKDETLTRRLQAVELKPVTKAEAERIITGLVPKFEAFHGVHYAEDVVPRAVTLADRWITDRAFPDKAIDLIDELAGAAKLQRSPDDDTVIEVSSDKLPELVARIARIPVDQVETREDGELADLDKVVRETVYGQDEAVDAVVSAIRMSRSGLGSAERPVGSFLFTGPTGVGKTELTRQLAKGMGIPLLRFDMSEYAESHTVSRLIGSPPGYVGYGEGGLLTEQVTKHPYSVVLLDEMEKAHPSLFNLLLQVMDHGKLTDASGREADFRNAVIIMTSNVGARDIERTSIGFESGSVGDEGEALKKAFTPEFRNRLDAIVRFAPLSRDSVSRVVDKFLSELTTQLTVRNVTPTYTTTFKNWLAQHGYDPHMGARPMRRLIADKVRRPLADELLFGRLKQGGAVTFDIRPDDEGKDVVVFDVAES
ncbi:MAG: AAA family ATPase [Sutterella wadsworthensis]|nr:AAA family ATPase [Sutterella wadsworthensis]